MHDVAVIAYDRAPAFEVAIPWEVFDSEELQGRYSVRLVAGEPGSLRTTTGWLLPAKDPLTSLAGADTVIMAGWRDPLEPPPPRLIQELRAAHRRGTRVVSLCTGAFALAAAGLLDGRRATTHWRHAPILASRFPRVTVDASVLYIDDHDILTSAGTAAGIDLCLHLVRRDHGAAIANAVARRLIVAPHRHGGQAQYAVRPVDDQHTGSIGPLISWMDHHHAQRMSVDSLARRAHLSRRQFIRRFVAATGTSPHAWLVQRRVLASRELLETTDLPVETIARRSGFGSAEALRAQFRRQVGSSPTAYRYAFTHSG